MTIPQLPPDNDLPEEREPGIDPDDPTPYDPPIEGPGLRAPGASEPDPPMRMPRDNPDVETEL